MVRLMLVLAPVMCILSGIGVSSILTAYMKNLDSSRRDKKPKKIDSSYPLKNEVCVGLSLLPLVLLLLKKIVSFFCQLHQSKLIMSEIMPSAFPAESEKVWFDKIVVGFRPLLLLA